MDVEWLPTYMSDVHELVAAFGDFWKHVSKLITKPVRPRALKIEAAREKEGESLRLNIGRNEPLMILGLASGGVRDAEKFDIYISGTQVVRRAMRDQDDEHCWFTVKSEFELLYLNGLENAEARRAWSRQEKVSHAYAGYQFTVETGEHCRLHASDCTARYSLDRIGEGAIQRIYRDSDDNWAYRATHRQPPIPAAPLDLVGILYLILHQHDSSSVVSGWPRDMRSVLAKLPSYRLERDERSIYARWYEHSHSTPDDIPWDSPKRQLPDFELPTEFIKDGWGARIAGRERNETPHLTVTHGRERRRVDLRTGKFMDGDPKWVPEPVWREIWRTLPKWQQLWDVFYGDDNPVKGK